MEELSKAIPNSINSLPIILKRLKDASSLLEEYKDKNVSLYNKLMATTLNNIACYYKRYLF